MNRFMEIHDSYELFEFARQYYLDIPEIDVKKMKFPIAVYFDEETGKPAFKSAHNQENFMYKIKFVNNGETYLFAANSIEEITAFIKEKGKKKPNPGDMVEVVNLDYTQPYNFEFFRDNFIDYEFACKFLYGEYPQEDIRYKVIIRCGETLLIQNDETQECFVIGEEGVEIVD